MKFRAAAVCGILLTLALAGCAAPGAQAPSSTPAADEPHGHIDGARELAEPALHLATIDPSGTVAHLDLLDEQSEVLAEIEPIDDLVTDGRYLFGIRDGSVTVIDSGAWTWSHIDHFHYYEAAARVLGDVTGAGTARVVAGDVGTGILFDDAAVLLENAGLAAGELVETFRIEVEPHEGMVVPLADGAAVTEPDAEGDVAALRVVDAGGEAVGTVACEQPAGSIFTVVGVVVGCADGAVLAVGGDAQEWESIPYPVGTADRAIEFAGRKWRPTVAGVSGGSGVWLLDTRERAWSFQDLGEPIVTAAAVDDKAEHVLALAQSGAVLVLADGEVVSRTEPLAAASLADSDSARHVRFVVDQNRAYLNGPAEGSLWEIDPADGARIARTFDVVEPLHLAGTGR